MVCEISVENRRSYTQRIVRLSIKSLCAEGTPVTQDTIIGPNGLGHGDDIRKQYYEKIKARLAANNCEMKSLTPNSFGDEKLVFVRDVTEKVLGDLQ